MHITYFFPFFSECYFGLIGVYINWQEAYDISGHNNYINSSNKLKYTRTYVYKYNTYYLVYFSIGKSNINQNDFPLHIVP